MAAPIRAAMARAGFVPGADNAIHFADDLDRGLEECENALLAGVAPEVMANGVVPVRDLLGTVVGDPGAAENLLPYLERLELAAGTVLIEQGAVASDIFFIEAGRAAVVLAAGSERLRLATLGPGSIVGEMAFYLGQPRSAAVSAETPVVAWRLSSASLARLEADLPDALIGLHRGMAALLAERLSGANRLVRLLSD